MMNYKKMKLHEKQIEAINLALDVNIKTLFITGAGGTGKSEIINKLMDKLNPNETILLAPTHSAALKIGGRTIHSFFKIRPTINLDVEKEEDVISFYLDEIDTENVNGKIVIIDEASMLGESVLTGILSRINPKKLILFGDPTQLKPIKDSPVDWSEFCDETVHLTHNYRVQNDKLRNIISHFRDSGELLDTVNRTDSIYNIKYNSDTFYIANENKTLSSMQKSLLGYKNARMGDTLITFGSCDESIKRQVGKVFISYFGNNDLVRVVSVPTLFDKGLWKCEVEREDCEQVAFNEYNKKATVIVGDYDVYKKTLQIRFKSAQNLQKELRERYGVEKSAILRKKMTKSESEDLRLKWIDYFNLKNSPYARHHQFRTTYKVQSQSLGSVVIDWQDLPGKDHKYVAISRAIEEVTIII